MEYKKINDNTLEQTEKTEIKKEVLELKKARLQAEINRIDVLLEMF